jgi:rfaE bifunctional protein kinase chain/domain
MMTRYAQILDRFPGRRLAVVGDCMVDRFLWGRVDRISPEAPVPVVRLERETIKLGGAANVASNIRALGAEVQLIGVAGEDEAGRTLLALLDEAGLAGSGILALPERPTTLKTRIIASHQQVVRTDREQDSPLGEEETTRLLARLEDLGPFDGIILSDYAKGVLTDLSLPRIIDYGRSHGSVVTVDPKHGDFAQYRGVTSLTPNQKEAGAACATPVQDLESLERVGRILLERAAAEAVLITRGEHGMALFEKNGRAHHLPTEATDVFDVTGAGDTVIATFTTALVSEATFLEAANLANHAAGLAVRELGTVTVSARALAEAMES